MIWQKHSSIQFLTHGVIFWEDGISHLGGQFWQMKYILWACQRDLISGGMCFLLYHISGQCQGKKGEEEQKVDMGINKHFQCSLA